MSGDFLSPPLAMRRELNGIARFQQNPLTAQECPRYTAGFGARVPPSTFSIFPTVFLAYMQLSTQRLSFSRGFSQLIAHPKLPPFPDLGFPGVSFASSVVSMGLNQCALTEVLIIPRWLPTATVQKSS